MHTADNNKYIAEMLNRVDEDTEVGVKMEDQNPIYGHITETRDVDQTETEYLLYREDGVNYTIYVTYTGDEDKNHTRTNATEYDITATTNDGDGTIYVVEAMSEFDLDGRVSDVPLNELAEMGDDQPESMYPAEEIRERAEETVRDINTTISELQEMREGMEKMAANEETIPEFERRLTEIELRAGGEATLDTLTNGF